MPAATRSGVDTAGGGVVTEAGQGFVSIAGALWVTLGAPIADHGDDEHNAATVSSGSSFVQIGGTPVVLAGSSATCAHTTTGSGSVSVSA